ncbi:amino acid ABC transporter permease [Rhodococcus koreensis]|uniref:amino acid ABC transporter permease n=1 Tax=Rhodococcus koreensis TaxID=99653 RepID=UPI002174DBDE|nr:amino acid ABC transporter permease [Rhodococcus koreensis]
MDRYTTAADTSTSSRAVLAEYGGPVLAAFRTTIALTVSAAVVAVLLGLVLVVMRLSPVASLRRAGTIYVEIVRNTPLTLILLFCSFGLAQTLGLTMVDSTSSTSLADSAFRLSVLGLGAYTATFVCEVLRAGVNTVARGQSEAARALGLGFGRTLGLVILPQALRSVIGPLGTVLIALTKNSTIASIIGVAEASLLMKEMVENTGALLLVGAIIAIGFMCLTLPTGQLFEFLAKKYSVKS